MTISDPFGLVLGVAGDETDHRGNDKDPDECSKGMTARPLTEVDTTDCDESANIREILSGQSPTGPRPIHRQTHPTASCSLHIHHFSFKCDCGYSRKGEVTSSCMR